MNDEIKWALRGIHARFDYLERVLARQGRNEIGRASCRERV